MVPKEQLYDFCTTFLGERSARIMERIAILQEDLASEPKSSAGDKHETGRAMIQLERERLGEQWAALELLQEQFKRVPLTTNLERVALGSVVYTSNLNYYIGISAGKVLIAGESFYTIAPDTPIGKLLLGKKVGEDVVFNKLAFRITEIG